MKRAIILLGLLCFHGITVHRIQAQERTITRADSTRIEQALRLIGLEFTWEEIGQMQRTLQGNLAGYESLRSHPVPNDLSPALYFEPLPPGYPVPGIEIRPQFSEPEMVVKPDRDRAGLAG